MKHASHAEAVLWTVLVCGLLDYAAVFVVQFRVEFVIVNVLTIDIPSGRLLCALRRLWGGGQD